MIDTIIFDIGMVLVDFCWQEHLYSFGFTEEINDKLAKATVLSPAWDELDRGRLMEEEILQLFIRNDTSIEAEICLFFKNIKGMIRCYDYTHEWLKELKDKGFRLYVLSNFSEKAYHEAIEELLFLEKMDGGILSYREKVIKPESEIYERLLKRYELKPENCIFFDDKPENVEGAKRAGIHGRVFTSQEEAKRQLEKLTF